MPVSEPLPNGKRMGLRAISILVVTIWAVLWPHNYGIDAHQWYWRAGALLLLTFRAMFIGWCACWFIMRPLLTVRTATQRPLPSVPQVLRALVQGLTQ